MKQNENQAKLSEGHTLNVAQTPKLITDLGKTH